MCEVKWLRTASRLRLAGPTPPEHRFLRVEVAIDHFPAKPFLRLGKVAFSAESDVNSNVSAIPAWRPQQKSSDFE